MQRAGRLRNPDDCRPERREGVLLRDRILRCAQIDRWPLRLGRVLERRGLVAVSKNLSLPRLDRSGMRTRRLERRHPSRLLRLQGEGAQVDQAVIELFGDLAPQLVPVQVKFLEGRQLAQLGRDFAGELVGEEAEGAQVGELAELGRDLTGELVAGQVEGAQAGEPAEVRRDFAGELGSRALPQLPGRGLGGWTGGPVQAGFRQSARWRGARLVRSPARRGGRA